jgi:hypothetical protein
MKQAATSIGDPGEIKVKAPGGFEFEGSGWILILVIGLVFFYIYARYWHTGLWNGTKKGARKLRDKLRRK